MKRVPQRVADRRPTRSPGSGGGLTLKADRYTHLKADKAGHDRERSLWRFGPSQRADKLPGVFGKQIKVFGNFRKRRRCWILQHRVKDSTAGVLFSPVLYLRSCRRGHSTNTADTTRATPRLLFFSQCFVCCVLSCPRLHERITLPVRPASRSIFSRSFDFFPGHVCRKFPTNPKECDLAPVRCIVRCSRTTRSCPSCPVVSAFS